MRGYDLYTERWRSILLHDSSRHWTFCWSQRKSPYLPTYATNADVLESSKSLGRLRWYLGLVPSVLL